MTDPRPTAAVSPAPRRAVPPIVALEGIDGAGKTTLAAALCTRLAEAGWRPRSSRLSPQMGMAMRRLVDEPTGGAQRYQDVVPSGFRHAVYVMEAAVQFTYMAEAADPADLYVFDRWLQTYDAYCEPPAVHAEWVRAVAATVPVPDVLASTANYLKSFGWQRGGGHQQPARVRPAGVRRHTCQSGFSGLANHGSAQPSSRHFLTT